MGNSDWQLKTKTMWDLVRSMLMWGTAGLTIASIVWLLVFQFYPGVVDGYLMRGNHAVPLVGKEAYSDLLPLTLTFIIISISGFAYDFISWHRDKIKVWHRESLKQPSTVFDIMEKVLKEKGISYNSTVSKAERNAYDPTFFKYGMSLVAYKLTIKIDYSDEIVSRIYMGPQTSENERMVEGLKKVVDEAVGVN